MALAGVLGKMLHRAMKNSPNPTVYISNLSYKRDRNGVRALFKAFGKIIDINVIVDPKTAEPRGMAFVEMSSVEEATLAIQNLDGKVIDGRTAKANYALHEKDPDAKFYVIKTDLKKHVKKDEKPVRDYKSGQLSKKKKNDEKREARAGFTFKAKAKTRKTV
jgi:RNA recognition motif-containing protein